MNFVPELALLILTAAVGDFSPIILLRFERPVPLPIDS